MTFNCPVILAFGAGGGEPLGQTRCFVLAVVFAFAAFWLLFSAFYRKWTWYARGGERGKGRMSSFGVFAWGMNCLLWAIALLAEALQYAPITTRALFLLFTGFGILMVATINDMCRQTK
jgi:hypothetical protein